MNNQSTVYILYVNNVLLSISLLLGGSGYGLVPVASNCSALIHVQRRLTGHVTINQH